MRRTTAAAIALLLIAGAAVWWAAGQAIAWRDYEIQALRLRSEVSAMVEELRRLPQVPPSLPDEAAAQRILAAWTGPAPHPGYSVRTSLSDRPPRGLQFDAALTVRSYQEALDAVDRLHRHEPAAITSVTIRRGKDGLEVNLRGYIAARVEPFRRSREVRE